MHQQPLDFTARRLATRKAPVRRVIELGSLDINGSPRHLFDDDVDYVGVDLQSGPGVDVVADAATVGLEPADVVLCLEVFEHATNPEAIIRNARVLLRRGGLFVASCAMDPRAPHSAIDERPIRPWEHYRNITPDEMAAWLSDGWRSVLVEPHPDRGDLYASATRA